MLPLRFDAGAGTTMAAVNGKREKQTEQTLVKAAPPNMSDSKADATCLAGPAKLLTFFDLNRLDHGRRQQKKGKSTRKRRW